MPRLEARGNWQGGAEHGMVAGMSMPLTSEEIRPTYDEEKLAHRLCNIWSLRYHGRKRNWEGSLEITWSERQAWYAVARNVLGVKA